MCQAEVKPGCEASDAAEDAATSIDAYGDAFFDRWIDDLRTVTIEDYGYEEGEFSIFPDMWRPLFDEGLTPQAAFKRALGAHAERRREEDAERRANWERIQREHAQFDRLHDQPLWTRDA